MSSRLSFSIAVKLLTDNFKKGSASVKSSLRSMQMQFMSFATAVAGGAIGLSNFVSRMIETAKETTSVNIALKNVSKSTEEYADHQKFIIDLSKKYGVQVNSLTSGFAKFKAAADISNMSLSDQYKIFESVSRAAVAFGLSAEDQRGVFLALSQMMSKGKIQAEELRLQMAERLPVAIQAMAKATGLSVEEMDKLMKQGKLYSSDVLPKFAEVLNEMIPNIDTDNLMTSLNRLSNAFVDLVKNWGIEEKFKSIVDVVSRLLTTLGNNAKAVFKTIEVLAFGGLGRGILKVFGHFTSLQEQEVANAEKLIKRELKAKEQTALAQKKLDDAETAYQAAKDAEAALSTETSEARRRRAYLKTEKLKAAVEDRKLRYQRALETQSATSTAVTESQRAAASRNNLGIIAKGFRGIGIAAKSAWKSISALLVTSAWSALIGLISAVVVKFIAWAREASRIKNIVSDMEKELAKKIDNTQIQNLEKYQKILTDPEQSKEARTGALKEINALLGENYSFDKLDSKMQDEINEKIKKRTRLLAAQDRYNRGQELANRKRSELRDIEDSEEYKEAFEKAYRDEFSNGRTAHEYITDVEYGKIETTPAIYAAASGRLNTQPLREAEELRKAISKADKEAEAAALEISNISGSIPPDKSENPSLFAAAGDEKELKKQQKRYTESLAALQKKLDTNVITQDEYDKALRELIEKSYINAYSSGDKAVLESKYYKALEKAFNELPRGEAYEAGLRRNKILKDYNESVKKRKAELEAGVITEKEYREALFDLTREARKSLASNMAGAADSDRTRFNELGDLTREFAPVPKLKVRDTSRDYKKTDLDILEESLAIAEQNKDIFLRLAEETGGMFSKELAEAMSNVKTLEEALKIAEAKKSVEELTKELHTGTYEGIKSIVGGVDNIVSSFERVGEVLSDGDASAWERIMAVWEAMISISDAFIQTIEIIERLTEVKEMLAKAELASAAASDAATDKKVANTAKNIAADTAETTSEVTNAGVKVAANTAEGASEAGKSASKLPFPWNIVAIGSAIAAALAAFAMIPRFENGGIVGGNSQKGDKILARLNSGEMVLNKGQQGTLYGLLSNRNRSIAVSGEFKVRGRDLVAAIDNNNKFNKRVR